MTNSYRVSVRIESITNAGIDASSIHLSAYKSLYLTSKSEYML
jgi:hypothetical protein